MKNTAATQNMTIKAFRIRAKRLSTLPEDHPLTSQLPSGENVQTGTLKLELVISLDAISCFAGANREEDSIIQRKMNIFRACVKKDIISIKKYF